MIDFQHISVDSQIPKINAIDGILSLYGNCDPDNADLALNELFDAIYSHLKKSKSLTIDFKLYFMNTGSSKKFANLIEKLNDYRAKDEFINSERKLVIVWRYDKTDEDMKELGEFYKTYSDSLAKKGKYKPINFKFYSYNYGS